MSLAFVFPGQGAQAVGMLAPWANSPAVTAMLQQADRSLGESLSGLIADGPAESLALTINTQPAMLVAGYAAYLAWIEAGGARPVAVAGHSLGEYTALTAAGTFSIEDAVQLVRLRAQAMQEAVPVGEGGMAALLGLSDDLVRQACAEARQGDEIVEAANYNAPAQVVISGHKLAVERACERARALGAKRALPLPVSAPFHSSLLRPSGERLAVALQALPMTEPCYDLVNNIDARVERDPARIRDALVRQSWGPVRWVEVVQQLVALGVTQVVELGPGKVLAGLVSRIDKSLKVCAVYDPPSLEAALKECSS
ncbi:MAG: [acyl-carrier-protein] S-malonyltransferase [Pseudomonadota bacterium]